MESTYYKLSVGKQTLSEGVFEIDPRIFVDSKAFTHARIELAEKSGYAIRWNEYWVHPTDSNFNPLGEEFETLVGRIEYGPNSTSSPHNVTVELLKISG
ncbi:hypothetical protein [Pseudomonas brassicacearum]|uniref:Uncharacterized protein n=1 Tax=Pseudomonas brassicacearum TaxID=930166 RepID=A0A423H297_9PSED|nr:hypothetical protein [Pseudomonas brassicacearum]RON06356.1 hypothetical protein BK658_00820 [Pseudomonas brassicacearum]